MSPPVRALRTATPDDAPWAFALYRALVHDLTVELLPWNEDAQRAVVEDAIAAGLVRIVEVDGAPVGWLQTNEGADAVELAQLYVEPAWQGRGIGSELVAEVLQRGRAAGRPVKLSVMRNNPRARALYERLGFVAVASDAYKVHLESALRVVEEPFDVLPEYARISIAFRVDRVLDDALRERPVAPYVKDYDTIPGNHPTDLPRQFDLTNWVLLGAHIGDERVGGAIVAYDTPGVDQLAGRRDLATLWDLRVAPDHRRSGVGRALFEAAADWARTRGCTELLVETQTDNVPACRFYAGRGCRLDAVRPGAYVHAPDEVQLLWIVSLG